jgi:hypothetical protein
LRDQPGPFTARLLSRPAERWLLLAWELVDGSRGVRLDAGDAKRRATRAPVLLGEGLSGEVAEWRRDLFSRYGPVEVVPSDVDAQ